MTLIGCIAVSNSLHARELSWKTCVDLASQNSADLRAARETLDATVFQQRGAASGFLPQLSAAAGVTQSNFGATSGTSSVFLNSTQTNEAASTQSVNTTFSISATQNIFSGFQDWAKILSSKASTERSRAQLSAARAKVSFDLKTAYQGLLYAEEAIELTKDILKRRQDNLRMVELRFESGRENRGSVLLSQAYLKQAQLDQVQAKNSRQTALAQLARTLGLPPSSDLSESSDLKVREPIPEVPPPKLPLDFEKLAAKTPEHLQAKAQEEIASASVTSAKSAFFPSLNLTASHSRVGTNSFPDNARWTLAASVSFPFFTGGRDYYELKSAWRNQSASIETRVHTDRQLIARLTQSYTSFVEAVLKVEVDRSFREAAQLRAEIARTKYNNGLLSFEDWDVIENDLIARQKALLLSQRDRVLNQASWEQTLGESVIP
jgi:outer membrane protein